MAKRVVVFGLSLGIGIFLLMGFWYIQPQEPIPPYPAYWLSRYGQAISFRDEQVEVCTVMMFPSVQPYGVVMRPGELYFPDTGQTQRYIWESQIGMVFRDDDGQFVVSIERLNDLIELLRGENPVPGRYIVVSGTGPIKPGVYSDYWYSDHARFCFD